MITSIFEAPVDISIVSCFYCFLVMLSSVLVFLKIFSCVPNIAFAKLIVDIWTLGLPPGRIDIAFARDLSTLRSPWPNCRAELRNSC